MAAKEISNCVVIDDGTKEYIFKNMQGKEFAKFSFNPTDVGMLERYDKVADTFKSFEFDESKPVSEQVTELNSKLKEQFNYLVGKDISSELFSNYTPCTIFANGDFFAEVAFNHIGQFIESEMNIRLDKKLAKIKKIASKR